MSGVSRRGLLAGGIAAAAASAFGSLGGRDHRSVRKLRVAFITDVHLDDNPKCVEGFARCLQKIERLRDKPDFIIQGGDLVYDALARDASSVYSQYSKAAQTLKENCSLRVEHVIGNHDIWGWSLPTGAQPRSDPRFGKQWWLNWTGYDSTYRSFDRNGWHFVLLDSIVADRKRGYLARLDDAQMRWLENDLSNTSPFTPVCIVSHIPILSSAAMLYGDSDRNGRWEVPSWLMHIDARRLKTLLNQHRNVKVCLSGHIHLHNRVDYNGVKHLGHGAVSGAWWNGPMQESPPGFGMLDFYADGDVKSSYWAY